MSSPPDWGSDAHLRLELAHLNWGARSDSVHVGSGPFPIRFRASQPERVVDRAALVLRVVVTAMLDGWDPSGDVVPEGLPEWFRRACASEGQSTDERWSLTEWLFWVPPGDRQWFWWNARQTTSGSGEVLIETTGVPFPTGALWWLLVASGAFDVKIPP